VLQEADQLDRVARRASQWSQIQQELRYISNVYGFRYNGGSGGSGRDDDWRRNDDYRRDRDRNNNNDWWRRIPLPRN
jgi:hypothetical protein